MRTSKLMRIERVSKLYKDGHTIVELKHDGWTYSTNEHVKVESGIAITMPDEFQPDWDTAYYVTVEAIPKGEIESQPGQHYSDKAKEWLARRAAKDAGAVDSPKPGRMFRKQENT